MVEMIFKSAPVVRRIAQTEMAYCFNRQPTAEEIVESLTSPLAHKLSMKELCRCTVCLQHRGALLCHAVIKTVLRQSHTGSVRKHFDRFEIIKILYTSDKGYNIAADTAAEAVKAVVFRINGE